MGNIGVSQRSFAGQLTIIEVEFGSECSFVGDEAFNGCSSLEKINEGNVIEEIGASAFAGTNIKSVQFNELTKLGSNAFDSCSNLENISIPICKDIPEEAFKNCTSLKSISISPFGEVVEIGKRAFQGCTSLSNANIDNSDTKIGAGAFQGCTSLSNLKLNNCIEIGSSAFSGCTGVTQIDLSKCSSIPEKAFFNCTNLKKIYIRKNDVKCTLDDVNAFHCDDESSEQDKKIEGFKVYVPRGDIFNSYKNDENWREYNIVYIVESKQIMYNSSDKKIIGNSEGEDIDGSYDSDGIVRYTNTYNEKDNYGLIEFDRDLLSLNDQIFKDSDTLLNVELPSKCKRIGEYEFSGCINLGSIGFQDDTKLEYIDDFAFQNCESLTEFTIPQSVESLGDGVFDGCVGIKKFEGKFATYNGKAVVCNGKLIHVLNIDNHRRLNISDIDSNITHLGKKCFRGHESLRRVDIPKSITSIGDNAFEDCKNIYEIHFAGDTPATLGEDVFKNVPKDKDFKILVPEASFEKYYEKWKDYSIWDHVYPKPESKSMIYFTTNNEEVSSNENYKDYVTNTEYINKCNKTYFKITSKNNNVTYIPSNFLSGKPSISKVIISEDITSIGDNAFSGCSNLDYIYLSDNILFLGAYCFKGNGIKRIHLPEPPEGKKLQYGVNPFVGCSNLEEFVAYQEKYTSADNRCYIDYVNNNSILRCFAPAGITEYQIPNGIEKIGNYAFKDCTNLKNVTIGNSVASIGGSAFRECTSLTSVTIPDSVTSIDSEVFLGCESLTSVTIPDSVTSIGYMSFSGCTSLKNVTIPDSVTSIGHYAFYYCKSLTSITIPDIVTSIGECAFADCSSLTSITIPGSVIEIEDQTFAGSGVQEVTIGDGVQYIGEQAFADCNNLTKVKISNSVIEIGDSAFDGCDNLENIKIPDNVGVIGSYAFYDCQNLTSVTIGDKVNMIGDYAFAECVNLSNVYCYPIEPPVISSSDIFDNSTDNITIYVPKDSRGKYEKEWSTYKEYIEGFSLSTITYTSSDGGVVKPINKSFYNNSTIVNIISNTYEDGQGVIILNNPVTSIAMGAFNECSNLKSITIPDSVTSIGNGAFNGCSNLESITIPDRVTSIGIAAFTGCSSLVEVSIPEGVSNIGMNTFYNCKSLYAVTIANSVTTIGTSAFEGCSNLTSVTIPDRIAFIGMNAFKNCTKLSSVYCKPIDPPLISADIFNNNASDRKIYVPHSSGIQYKTNQNWVDYESAIVGYDFEKGEVVDKPFNNEIWYTSADGSVVEPNTLNFSGVNGRFLTITNTYSNGRGIISFEGELTTIGSNVFDNCEYLTSVTIPDSVTLIGGAAFKNCTSMKSINIPNGVKLIGNEAFCSCKNLEKITIPDSVTDIGKSAFYDCGALTNVTLGKSVNSIEEFTFANCYNISSITIPDSVVEIGQNAFECCTGLTNVTIGKNVNSIGIDAFYECSGIESIEIPNSVTSIGGNAFHGCENLTSVSIGSGVTSIGKSAFEMCACLESVYCYPTTPPEIGSYAFDENALNRKIYVHIASKDAYKEKCSDYANDIRDFGTSIIYKSSDGKIIEPNYDALGAKKVSNIYNIKNNYGIITFESPVTKIGSGVFTEVNRNTKLMSIMIPDTATEIGGGAFSMCEMLSNVSIGSGVTSIGNAAFDGCEKLESIYIPDNVTSIGDMAFQSCTELKTITLGSGVESIGCGVFWNCVRLYDVYCKPINPPKIWDDTFYTVNLSGTYLCGIGKIYVPQDSEYEYKNAENWKSVASKIQVYSFND